MRVCRKSSTERRRAKFYCNVPKRAGGRRPGTGFPSKVALETTRPNARCHGRLPFSVSDFLIPGACLAKVPPTFYPRTMCSRRLGVELKGPKIERD